MFLFIVVPVVLPFIVVSDVLVHYGSFSTFYCCICSWWLWNLFLFYCIFCSCSFWQLFWGIS